MAVTGAHLNAEIILVTVYHYSLPLPASPGISGLTGTSLETTPHSTNQPTKQRKLNDNKCTVSEKKDHGGRVFVVLLSPLMETKTFDKTERWWCCFYTSPICLEQFASNTPL